jgi:uncharacterized membrane protein YqjE
MYRSTRSDEMLLALAVWLCGLPLLTLIVLPWLGWPAALTAAAVLLLAALAACWGACGWKVVASRRRRI